LLNELLDSAPRARLAFADPVCVVTIVQV